MRMRMIPVVLTGVLVASLALFRLMRPSKPVSKRSKDASSTRKPDFAKIDMYAQTQLEKSRIPGLALGIVQGDQIVHLKGIGRADDSGRAVTPQTPFCIGSTSKSFTALAVMQLVEAGKIELDAPVQRYIPWFRVADPVASARITVRQLLNQTSGLTEAAGKGAVIGAGPETLEQAVRDLCTAELNRPVGISFEYSNLNYLTLGLVVQMVSQEPYEIYLQQHIFEPLEMRHTYTSNEQAKRDGLASGYRYWFGFPVAFDASSPPYLLAAGGIISTAEDMSHYLAMYLSEGRYHGKVLLSPDGIAQMHHPAAHVTTSVEAGADYGMGSYIGKWGGADAVYHFGDTSNSHAGMVLVPHGDWGIIVLFNVGLHGGMFSSLLAIEQSVTGLVAGGQGATDARIGTIYLVLDLAISVVLALQGWSLIRLVRRHGDLEFPMRDLSHALGQGRRWVLPLLWEFGLPVAIARMIPKRAQVSWKGIMLFAPDLGYSFIGIGGVFLLTGLIRAVKAGLSLLAG